MFSKKAVEVSPETARPLASLLLDAAGLDEAGPFLFVLVDEGGPSASPKAGLLRGVLSSGAHPRDPLARYDRK
jgi:hypothetical protein